MSERMNLGSGRLFRESLDLSDIRLNRRSFIFPADAVLRTLTAPRLHSSVSIYLRYSLRTRISYLGFLFRAVSSWHR